MAVLDNFSGIRPLQTWNSALKKAPRYIRVIFPTRYRLFDGTHFCLPTIPRFGVRCTAGGHRQEERQSASKKVLLLLLSKNKAYRGIMTFDASEPGRAAIWAILALSRARHAPERALIFSLYPVRGLTEHRISNRGPLLPTLLGAVPVSLPLNP